MEIYIPKDLSEIIGLPDGFHYDFYQEFSKERDLSRWGFEFAKRQNGMTKAKLLEITGGIGYENGVYDVKTIWRNGVYGTNGLEVNFIKNINGRETHSIESAHDCKNYLDDINTQHLEDIKAIFVPDGEENKYKEKIKGYKPIVNGLSTPEFENYKKWRGKLGKTYFPTVDKFNEYFTKSESLNKKTATFLINLEMPTSKILSEIKNRIEKLKDKKSIPEIKRKNYKYDTWAMGLACFDLEKGGVEQDVIIKKYLSFCYDGSQKPDSTSLEAMDYERWRNTFVPVCKMINGDWKSLVGNP